VWYDISVIFEYGQAYIYPALGRTCGIKEYSDWPPRKNSSEVSAGQNAQLDPWKPFHISH
jgi:hypothetical protein